MHKKFNKTKRKVHDENCTCSLCGQKYGSFSFKSGYICESCVEYIKNTHTEPHSPDARSSTSDNSDDPSYISDL